MTDHQYRKSLDESSLSRLLSSFRNRGLWRTLEIVFELPSNYFFDFRYGTNTARNLSLNAMEVVGSNKARATWAESTQQRPFRALMRQLQLPCKGDFVDLGSGKGKVLLLASAYPFENIVGVEFAEELNDICRENIRRYTRKKSPQGNIQVITGDVVDFRFSGREEVIYISNPFDGIILDQVLQNIVASVQASDRDLWVIYSAAIYRKVLDDCTLFETILETSMGGHDFVVYHHRAAS